MGWMPVKKVKIRFTKEQPLPEDFTYDYVIALKALSKKHKDDPEVRKNIRLLERMSSEAFLAGRGEVWIPRPDALSGHYPIIADVPYPKVRQAIRKNTKRRAKAWKHVEASTRRFVPMRSTISDVEKSLMPAILMSFPFKRGRTPFFLGKRVPGDMHMSSIGSGRSSGSSIKSIRDIEPEEWKERGFQPLKFSFKTWRENIRVRAKEGRKKGLKKLLTASKLENRMLGPENLTHEQAKVLVKKLAAPGTKTRVAKGARPLFASNWPSGKKKVQLINTPRNAAAIAHEATHSRDHKKLGKAWRPLYGVLPAVGLMGGYGVAAARAAKLGRFRHMSKWAAPAIVAGSHLPRLAIEGHAAKNAWKYPGGKRAAATTSTYPVDTALQAGAAAGIGHHVGGTLRKSLLAGARNSRTLRSLKPRKFAHSYGPALQYKQAYLERMNNTMKQRTLFATQTEVLSYQRGLRYGLRSVFSPRNLKQALRKGALPAVIGGVIMESLRQLHNEVGIPSTTVDLVPVQRTSFRGELAPYSNWKLKRLQKGLLNDLVDLQRPTVTARKDPFASDPFASDPFASDPFSVSSSQSPDEILRAEAMSKMKEAAIQEITKSMAKAFAEMQSRRHV